MDWERENEILNPHGIRIEGTKRWPYIIHDSDYETSQWARILYDSQRGWFVSNVSTWWYDEKKLRSFIDRLTLMQELLVQLNVAKPITKS